MTNTRIDIGDDCFSPKPNTSNIFVQNLWCNNTHGVSMGSIGQYAGQLDYIEHAYIENVTLLNGQVSSTLSYKKLIIDADNNRTEPALRLGLVKMSDTAALTTLPIATFISRIPMLPWFWISATSMWMQRSVPPILPRLTSQTSSLTTFMEHHPARIRKSSWT